MARPRLSVDFDIVLRLRDFQNIGLPGTAELYRKLTGEYVSRDTMKRRYSRPSAKSRILGAPTDERAS